MVKSDVSFRSRDGRQRPWTLPRSKGSGLAKKLERHSLSPATLTKYYSNSVRQRVCRCSRFIKIISTCKDSLSGLHARKTEKSIACTSEPHECATCRSSV